VEDSEGPGEFRGGLGLRRDYWFPEALTFTILADRDRVGPWGLFGGEPGRRAEYLLIHPNGEAVTVSAKATLELQPGDIVSYRTCGGGGYGPPWRRDSARVLRDVRQGKISLARARTAYGVVIDQADWQVDQGATTGLRAAGAAQPEFGT
jgi:N-methylhydantoinase B